MRCIAAPLQESYSKRKLSNATTARRNILFEDSESISLNFRLLNAEGRALVSPQGTMPPFDAYACRIPEITVGRRLSLADWRAAILDHAVVITNELYLRFNWPNPNMGAARLVHGILD